MTSPDVNKNTCNQYSYIYMNLELYAQYQHYRNRKEHIVRFNLYSIHYYSDGFALQYAFALYTYVLIVFTVKCVSFCTCVSKRANE